MKVLLGVTGGIAAFRACEVVLQLRKAGHEVRVVMTEGARQFVTPLTFEALSANPEQALSSSGCSGWRTRRT